MTGFAVGQPVGALLNDFGRGPRAGGYAEVAVAHVSMAVPLPEGVDLARVAGVLVNGVTAWMALHDLAHLRVNDNVLVLGASGGLGGTVSRLAAVHPARHVIGVVGGEAKRASAAEECTKVITAADLGAAVDELTDGRGVDVIVDPVGGELRVQAYERLAPFGRFLVLGNASGEDPALSGDAAWHGTRQLIGLSLGAVAHLVPEQVRTALSAVVDLTHRGVLRKSKLGSRWWPNGHVHRMSHPQSGPRAFLEDGPCAGETLTVGRDEDGNVPAEIMLEVPGWRRGTGGEGAQGAPDTSDGTSLGVVTYVRQGADMNLGVWRYRVAANEHRAEPST